MNDPEATEAEPKRSPEKLRAAFEQMTREPREREAADRLDALEAQLAELRERVEALEGAKDGR